ncbi:double-strand break repair protein AddB [Glycocaulis abyssi]|uniref:Double-strand break repair protein AddB n=1 Tax=Glycocaulis abyssi TaxID=1433403 RepID=A0ABV9NEN1_9PROT
MSAPIIFDTPAPRVFTLSPAADFLLSLARTLSEAFPEPEALAGVTVLLPTRRAGRALGEAFSAIQAQKGIPAAILPLIRPLGDVDADEPPFEPGEFATLALPAISAARRRFELASLIIARETASGREMAADGALVLADTLAGLLDEFASEGVDDLSGLDAAMRAALPQGRQEAAMFLDIVLEAWPRHLAALGLVDPARRRSGLLNALAARWREVPPDGPVIAAGSTGSIPAAAELLATVCRLEQGAVVLPGFAGFMDDSSWNAIDDGHPQRAMKSLIERIGISRQEVREWPIRERIYWPGRSAEARARLVTEALRPADQTADWLLRLAALGKEWKGDIVKEGLRGLSVIEARDPASEARAIALALRHTLTIPGRTAMVVTPDRALARRVTTEMARFDVRLDDSAGEALSDTAPGSFLVRVLEAASDPGSALALTALWASPLFTLGRPRPALMAALTALEAKRLRGRRPGQSLGDVRARIKDGDPDIWRVLIDEIEQGLTPLLALEGEQPVRVWAAALAQAGEALARGAAQAGADRLWAGEAGEQAAGLMREFLEEADALPALSLRAFSRIWLETARARRVRPRSGTHPRLALLGPLEARLLHADLVILAGLNEGVWPQAMAADPFLSRGMRKAAGLPSPERRLGLSAHDFAELASTAEVILTRSTMADGAPTVASRWMWRLQTLARGKLGADHVGDALKPDPDYAALASALDAPERVLLPAPEPLPTPPLADRPREMPVTGAETWVRDPYAVYAKRILKLRVLDPLDQEPGGAERGTAWHAALEQWTRQLGDRPILPETAHAELVALGEAALLEAGFAQSDLGSELPRFSHAASWVVAWEAERRVNGIVPAGQGVEAEGRIDIRAPGGPFRLTARADRIDSGPDGYHILDFKTGRIPSVKEVLAGFSPQLTLQGAILAGGGFDGIPAGPIAGYAYIGVKGTKKPGEVRGITDQPPKGEPARNPEELADAALERLGRYIAKFDDPSTPYHSQPRRKFVNEYGDYDHLARRKEWSTAPDKESGNGEDEA